MVEFRDLLSPEARAKLDSMKARELLEQEKLQKFSNKELAEYVIHNMSNCFGLRRVANEYRGSPVYDSAFWFVLMPLIIERLKDA